MPLADWLQSALPDELLWQGRPTEEALRPLPNHPALYLLISDDGTPVQLGTTQQLRRLSVSRLILNEQAEGPRTDLGEIVRGVRWRGVSNPLEATWWYYRLARGLHPREYRKLIGFGPSWFLQIDFADALPEMRVTDQVWRVRGECVGPLASQRAATQALESLWDLFDLCRQPEQYRKSPGGSRCAYADMGRCDAPCDGSVAPAAMIERTRAAWRFVLGGAAAWIDELSQQMKSAAAAQRFEEAGRIKARVAAAREWLGSFGARVMPIEAMRFVVALPVTRRAAWKFVWFDRGVMLEGPQIATRKLAAELAAWIAAMVAGPDGVAECDVALRMEQTWLVSRWIEPSDRPRCLHVRLREGATAVDVAKSLIELIDEFRAVDEPETDDTSAMPRDDGGA